VTYTCAHAHARARTHTHTQRQTHAQMPHLRSSSPTRTLSLCCCQTKAWKAGHNGQCDTARAGAGTRTAAKPTAYQMRVLEILQQLADAADWRGVAAQERAARAVAAALRTSMPGMAAGVYCLLGNAYQNLGRFSKALEHHAQHLTMAKEVGDRAGEGAAYGNLGNAYKSIGDFSKVIEHHAQQLAIAKEVGDWAGEGAAYGNLGNAYKSLGDFSKAIEHHAQQLAIAKEVGDRAGEGRAYGNLGTGHLYLMEYVKAFAYLEAQHALAISLKLAHMQSDAALNMGVALTLHVRAGRQGTATGADQAPGPHSHSSASACLNDRVREAAYWLETLRWWPSICKTTPGESTISKSNSRGECNGDVTLVPGVIRRGARTLQCSRAAAAV
jgi:tetratricopeptide (TPR) repeat protein